MTDRDPFNPFEELDRLNPPAPDPAAKQRAIAAARARFEANIAADVSAETSPDASASSATQGFRRRLRPMFGNNARHGRSAMMVNPRFAAGLAAACLGIVAVGLTLQLNEEPAKAIRDAQREEELAATGFAEAEPRERRGMTEQDEVAAGGSGAAPNTSADRADASADALGATGPRQAGPPRVARRLQSEQAVAGAPSRKAEPPAARPEPDGRDRFTAFEDNGVQRVADAPVSTFSVDVDTAAYSFVRRMLNAGRLPQPDAVRTEEMLNYFDYAYPLPASRARPFAPNVWLSDAPWAEGRELLQIGIQGYELPAGSQPRSNLVFLLDVSGSMRSPDKLPLVRQSMELLLSTLQPEDTVAIAVYAGAAGTVLPPTKVAEKQTIFEAMRGLNAGGSTSGAQGIRLAYELAAANREAGAVNRVILATDGDFNVGISNPRELEGFVARQREAGIYLSVLGFGQGNYNDALMQALAQNGNGVAAYIDTLGEAQKVLVHEATSTLFPIAEDVKIQVEFNPRRVAEYRLLGYETRALAREDFANDRVDAGDVGAGHSVTALYEIARVGSAGVQVPASRYAAVEQAGLKGEVSEELAFLKIRYKLPGEEDSRLISRPITDADRVTTGSVPAREARFAAAVAGAAALLRGGEQAGTLDWDKLIELAQGAKGEDPYGYRTEFVQLLRKAKIAGGM